MLKQLLNEDLKDYRPIPFWSWNDKLEETELRRQIVHMKNAGIGGFFMHARGGLQTEYLGEEWFSAVKVCIDEAKKQNMNAWCYDENGWPSGFAGMKLLEDSENLCHYLTYSLNDSFDDNALAVYKLENCNISRITKNEDSVKEYICVYDKTNSSVVDVLNKEVIKKFIEETHEKYYDRFKEHFGNVMLGFFTDEPQYFRWDTAYTPVLLTEFQKEYGIDVLDALGALFVDCEQSFEFRFQYWRLMSKLYIENFAKQIFDWCDKHNCKLTGHTIEESKLFMQMWCCAGVMPFYEYEHIPGIDWLGREISNEMSPKQVSSVAMQLGKKQVLTETFACTGWDVTPKELKRVAEWQFVNGVNLMCHHLYPYSIRGQRKRDYPTFFSEHNPWIKEFITFNDYFAKLGFMLAESKEVARVAVIHPMHSTYLTYNRKKDYQSIKEVEDDFAFLIEKMASANIDHHYIDELLLEKHGSVKGNKFVMGLCEYDYVVIPKMQNLDRSTAVLLKQFLENGGKLYLEGNAPDFVDGKKEDLDFLKPNVSFEDLINNDFYINKKNTEIRSTYRKAEFGDFIFAVNVSKDKEYSVEYTVAAKGACLFDLELNDEVPLYFKKKKGNIKIPLSFKAGQSFVILLKDDAKPKESPQSVAKEQSYDTNMTLVNATENALTLDYAALSYDNVYFEEKWPIMALSERLLKEQKNRKVYLKYTFEVLEIPNNIHFEIENMNLGDIYFNGQKVTPDEQAHLDKSFLRKDISKLIVLGTNEIVVEANYYQSEHVNYVLFGAKEGTESLMNCLSYDTDIEVMYIVGDFSVISKNGFVEGNKNTRLAKGDFVITKQEKNINAKEIVEQGFPFFAGEITIEKQIYIENKSCTLELKGRFAVASVYVNEKLVKTMMFDNICDISEFVHIGDNKLTIKLINSNRNLLGPFHCSYDEEPLVVCPDTFSMQNTWENDKSSEYRESYSFVHFGIDEIMIKY